jgi:hypothetical protein
MNQDDMRQHKEARKPARFDDICPILFHPDYTVGPGMTPDLLTSSNSQGIAGPLAGYTAGGDLHPALRIMPE